MLNSAKSEYLMAHQTLNNSAIYFEIAQICLQMHYLTIETFCISEEIVYPGILVFNKIMSIQSCPSCKISWM